MATPKIRFPLDLTVEENTLAESMAVEAGSKSAAFKSSLLLMKNIKDAIREGNRVMIVSATGQQTQLSCL